MNVFVSFTVMTASASCCYANEINLNACLMYVLTSIDDLAEKVFAS